MPGSQKVLSKPRSVIAAILLSCIYAQSSAQDSSPLTRHFIDVKLTPDNGEIRISDKLLVAGREQYQFRLVPWLDIESLTLDGREVSPERQGDRYVVALPDTGQHELRFTLRGSIPARNTRQGSSPGLNSSSGVDGVYLPGYDAWIPQDAGGYMSYHLMVSVPPGQRAVATGKLISDQATRQHYQAIFETLNPSEAPSLFVGPYQLRERQSEGLRLRTYFHAELADFADTYLAAADRFLQRYQVSIGRYPYDDFHIVSAPLPVGLGFPNLTYVSRRVIPLPFMRARSLAHEVLHNWWGNGVRVDYASGNWAEGLTTYQADYALAVDQGRVAARAMRVKWLRDYAALPVERDHPANAFKSKRHQASQVIGYNKVAFIFHMLVNEIGQPAFDDGLQLFWNKYQNKLARWKELQAAFEQASGRDLDWFFVQWVQRSGAPRLSLGAISVEQDEAGFHTHIEILQPVTGYRFNLPVMLATTDGSQKHEITISDTLTRIEFVTQGKPIYFKADPDNDIFRRLHQNETVPILRDVTLDPAASTLIASADSEFVGVARDLAVRMMDTRPNFVNRTTTSKAGRSLLLITTNDSLTEQLSLLQLEPPVGLPDGAYSATAWTARRADGSVVLVVSAASTDDLRLLLRPLPHYGGQSYILFEAGRALERGVWTITGGALFRRL